MIDKGSIKMKTYIVKTNVLLRVSKCGIPLDETFSSK
jgi:hypothetical protein